MDPHTNAEWQAWLTGFGWLLAAVLISQIAHYVLYALFRRLSLRRHSMVAEEIVTHTQQVSRLVFLLLAVSMVLPNSMFLIGWRIRWNTASELVTSS